MMEHSPAGFERDDVPFAGPAAAARLDRRTKFEILGAILLGLFLGALDQTIVGTALPRIVTDLHGNDLYTWVVTIYLLTSTVSGPFYGKLSDLYGRKPLLIFGIVLFLAGSALSGLSQDMTQLILFRGIQGLGAGSLFPISLAVIGDLFTPAERGKYQGLFGAVFGISALIGPALGGFLTDVISWHWVFYVNLPVGAVSLYIIWRLMPTLRRAGITHRLDYLGAAVFTVAISLLLIGLTNKQTGDWTDPAVGGFILIALVGIAIFALIETRAAEPVVPLDLFRDRTYTTSIVATTLTSFGFFAAVIFLPRWFQFVEGLSATESGYATLPLLVGLILSSVVSGQIVARTGRYKWLTVGAVAVMTFGMGLMTLLRATTPIPVLWVWMFIAGLGIGPTLAVFTIIVQNAVPIAKLGAATSTLTFFRQVGGSIGLAITGTVFGSAFVDGLPRELRSAGVPDQLVAAFAQGGAARTGEITGVGADLGATILAQVPEQFRSIVEPWIPQVVAGVHEAFSVAVAQAIWVGVAAGVVAVAVAALMRELPLRTGFGPGHAPEARARRIERAAAID